jgi:hypothetical protein
VAEADAIRDTAGLDSELLSDHYQIRSPGLERLRWHAADRRAQRHENPEDDLWGGPGFQSAGNIDWNQYDSVFEFEGPPLIRFLAGNRQQ